MSLLLQSRMSHTDDTRVKMLDPPPYSVPTGRLGGCLGGDGHPYNAFDFSPNRQRNGPHRFPSSCSTGVV